MFDGAERPLTDYDLARLCLVAEPRRKVNDAAIGGIFATMLEADLKNSGDVMGRIFACEGLAKRSTSSAVKALRAALNEDPFFGVRQAAARALRWAYQASASP